MRGYAKTPSFHELQTTLGADSYLLASKKQGLRRRLNALGTELDGYLAREYDVDRIAYQDVATYEEHLTKWRENHQPLHWLVEYYAVMHAGGFDIVIGNPPYVEYAKIRSMYQIRGYQTEACGNLYAFVMERSLRLLLSCGGFGMIVPVR